MDEFEVYRTKVDAYWPAVDEYFDDLPGTLHRQGRLLRENLVLRTSKTGEFRDILRRPDDHPMLHYHVWLLDDLGIAAGAERTSLEAHPFSASVYAICLASLHRDLRAADSLVDAEYTGLADSLSRQAIREFATVVDNDTPFWEAHRTLWDGAADEVAGGEVGAPFMLSGLAVLYATEGGERGARLLAMLERLQAVLALRHDLLAIRRDLSRGTITAPVRVMMEAAGIEDAVVLDPPRVLGALLLSGAVDALSPTWRGDITAFEQGAADLGLPTFERYAHHLETMMEKLAASLRLGGDRPPAPPPRFEPASTPLPQALSMAEGFLLADQSFRDAWEVHRWGMAGAPEVTARFPAGLVIEILGKHGHDVGDLIDDFYQGAADQRFAYYDHPDLPYVETDTLGTMLRLYSYSKQTEWHRGILDRFIALLEPHVGNDGRLPVWLVDAGHEAPPLLGEGCGTIEANLLRGLLRYDQERFAGLVTASAARLFEDFEARGAGITVNYPRAYLLSTLAALLDELDAPLDPVWERLATAISTESARDRLTPLTAACVILAASPTRTEHLLDERWGTTVLKGQSFDGAWPGEPMFFAPNRGGESTWYSSRLLTSAVCYDALNSLPAEDRPSDTA